MPGTVKIGARELPINELTLGDMRKIGIGTAKARRFPDDVVKSEEAFYESTLEIIFLATGVPQKELEAIKGSSLKELLEARRQIIIAAGLITEEEAGDAKPGEVKGSVTG